LHVYKYKQGQRKAWRIPSPKHLTFDLENQKGFRFSKGLSMYQVWSKSIEGCWF